MESYIVKRDNDKDIKFVGELIATVESNANNASYRYSGSAGRWSELSIFKTKGGKYVCQKIDCTQWQGERYRYYAAVATNTDEIFEFFGGHWLAEALYKAADIEIADEIE